MSCLFGQPFVFDSNGGVEYAVLVEVNLLDLRIIHRMIKSITGAAGSGAEDIHIRVSGSDRIGVLSSVCSEVRTSFILTQPNSA